MTVRVKASALVIASFVVALLAIHFVAHNVLVPSYASLEAQSVRLNVNRTVQALEAIYTSVDSTNHDWASWDDTCDFIATRGTDYIESNMVDTAFVNLGINIMVILDTSGDIIYARAVDNQGGESSSAPVELLAHLSPGGHLLSRTMTGDSVSGVLSAQHGPLIISSRPVLSSDESGPVRGVFLMGRYLDDDVLSEISDLTLLSASIEVLGLSVAGGIESAGSSPAASAITVTPQGRHAVEGATTLNDIYGSPVLRLRVAQQRGIYNEGQRTITFFLTMLLVGGLILALVFLAVLDRTLLKRLSRLATELQSIGEQQSFTGAVTVTGDDEISLLGRSLNEALSRLQQTHHQLEESHRTLERSNVDLKRAKQELLTASGQARRLTRQLQSMREDERARVAHEIHDQMGQGLAALKMDLAALQRSTARGQTVPPETLQPMSDLVSSLLDTVRKLSASLRTSLLEDLGLAEALEWQLEEFRAERSVHASMRIQGPVAEVESSRALAIFRILQEALQVCAEDDSITEVGVTLTVERRYALLAVQDNGSVDLSAESITRREVLLGLIRERVEVFGGGITYHATAESGSSIVAQVML